MCTLHTQYRYTSVHNILEVYTNTCNQFCVKRVCECKYSVPISNRWIAIKCSVSFCDRRGAYVLYVFDKSYIRCIPTDKILYHICIICWNRYGTSALLCYTVRCNATAMRLNLLHLKIKKMHIQIKQTFPSIDLDGFCARNRAYFPPIGTWIQLNWIELQFLIHIAFNGWNRLKWID